MLAVVLVWFAGLVTVSIAPAVYVYPLPCCSFEHLRDEVQRFGERYEPVWPMHERIASGAHVTSDPAKADIFYIPAPLFLWAYDVCESITKGPCPVDAHRDCLQRIQQHVEASPWLQRRRGWDHFVLFGSNDYPATPALMPKDADFVLERAWPIFANFLKVTIGSRAERCSLMADEDQSCAKRLMRYVTVPIASTSERFHCDRMRDLAEKNRSVRIAFHGMSYMAMPERERFKEAVKCLRGGFNFALRQTVLEFQNWSHVQATQVGRCKPSAAFEGLCPWRRTVADDRDQIEASAQRHATTQRDSEKLAEQTQACFVMPGDGGYTLRLWTVLASACIPVIVSSGRLSFPRLPFSRALPWHDFAFFVDIGDSFLIPRSLALDPDTVLKTQAERTLTDQVLLAQNVILQFVVMDTGLLAKKRAALLRHAASFSWDEHAGCGNGGERQPSALDLLLDDVAHRAGLAADDVRPEVLDHKTGQVHIASSSLDGNVNGCPLYYPMCYIASKDTQGSESAAFGDHRCVPFMDMETPKLGYKCPAGCETLAGKAGCWSVGAGNEVPKPCSGCLGQVDPPSESFLPGRLENQFPKPLPLLCFLYTRSMWGVAHRSLDWLEAKWRDRYRIVAEDEPLLDARDYHHSWNQLALVRRCLLTSEDEIVTAIDEGLAIAAAARGGRLLEELDNLFFSVGIRFLMEPDKFLMAPVDSDQRIFTGWLAFRNDKNSLELIDGFFRLGNALHPKGNWPMRRTSYRHAINAYMESYSEARIVLLKPLWNWFTRAAVL